MTWQDLVNGGFELIGAPFIMLSIITLARKKRVAGVSWVHTSFFSVWGLWNLYFYPHLGQWASFVGGIAIVTTNTFWLGQMIYYTRHPGKPGWTDPEPEISVDKTPEKKDLNNVSA